MTEHTPKQPQPSQSPAKKSLFASRWMQFLIIVLVLAVGIGAAQTLIATAPKAEKKQRPKESRLITDLPLSAVNSQVLLTGYGVVEAEQLVNLQAQVSGLVKTLSDSFVPGRRVKRGEVLLTLDETDYKLALANAQASLAQAKAAYRTELGNQAVAKADFELLGMEVSDREEDLILRKPQLESARASIDAAQAAVNQAKVNLSRTVVRAPFDGIVVSRMAAQGGQVSPSVTLGTLASSENFWINVAVPQQDLKWIRFPAQGQAGSMVCVSDASAATTTDCHQGQVLNLQGFVQDNGRQAQVLVEVPVSSDPKTSPLLIGQYAKVVFEGRVLSDVFELDPSHVHGDTVWINKEGLLEIRPVNIAFRSQNKVLVDDGLQNGERLITSNLSAPVSGMAIRNQEAGGQTATEPATDTKGQP